MADSTKADNVLRVKWLHACLLCSIAACSFDSSHLQTKQCPCIEGWMCFNGRCIPELDSDVDADASVEDASSDAIADTASDALVDMTIDSEVDAPDVSDAALDLTADATQDADATTDADPQMCSGTFMCEDFETGLDGWSPSGVGLATTSMTQHLSGTSALFVQTSNPGDNIRVIGTANTLGDYYFRYHFFPTQPTPMTIFAMYQSVDRTGFDMNTANGRVGIYDYDSQNSIRTTNDININDWNCVSGHVVVDSTAGSYEIRVNDGTPLVMMNLDTVPDSGPIDSVAIGALNLLSSSTGPVEAYFDDLVIGPNALPCQ